MKKKLTLGLNGGGNNTEGDGVGVLDGLDLTERKGEVLALSEDLAVLQNPGFTVGDNRQTLFVEYRRVKEGSESTIHQI
jgi:hypothetical protein